MARTVFNPLGFLASFILMEKQILQDLGRIRRADEVHSNQIVGVQTVSAMETAE